MCRIPLVEGAATDGVAAPPDAKRQRTAAAIAARMKRRQVLVARCSAAEFAKATKRLEGRVTSRSDLLSELNSWEGGGGYKVTEYRLMLWMEELGMEHGLLDVDWSAYHEGPRRQAQILRFVLQYDKALKEEAAGEAIILYMGESYVDILQHSRRGWRTQSKGSGRFPKGAGQRLVLVHAIT